MPQKVTQKVTRPKRIRQRTSNVVVVFSVAGLLFALFAVALALRPSQVESKANDEPIRIAQDFDTVLIPTPTRAVARGEKLGDVPFTTVKWPKNRLSENYISEVESYREAIALSALPKYLPIPVASVSLEPIDSNAVVEGIPEGMRAITVRVDEESAVEGWARSGNYVDVILLRSSKDTAIGLEAKVIAENVKILSAERSTTPIAGSGTAPAAPKTVTLLTSQEDALKIKTAANVGKLTFALRGRGDQHPTLATAMNQRRLLGEAKTAKIAQENFRGYARGPDGKVYVLSGDDTRWLQTPEPPQEAPAAFQDESRAQLNIQSAEKDAEKEVEGE